MSQNLSLKKSEEPLLTRTWTCECGCENPTYLKACKNCSSTVPDSLKETIFKEEIEYQNKIHAYEEKQRKEVFILFGLLAVFFLHELIFAFIAFLLKVILFLFVVLAIAMGALSVFVMVKGVVKRTAMEQMGYGIYAAYLVFMVLTSIIIKVTNTWDMVLGIAMTVCTGGFALSSLIEAIKNKRLGIAITLFITALITFGIGYWMYKSGALLILHN